MTKNSSDLLVFKYMSVFLGLDRKTTTDNILNTFSYLYILPQFMFVHMYLIIIL